LIRKKLGVMAIACRGIDDEIARAHMALKDLVHLFGQTHLALV